MLVIDRQTLSKPKDSEDWLLLLGNNDFVMQSMLFVQENNSCLIDGKCYSSNELHPTNKSLLCNPHINATSWSDGLYPFCSL